MKKTIVALSVFTLLVAVAAGNAVTHKLTANVPFNFFVGSRSMPAGQYMIDVGGAVGNGVIIVVNSRSARSALVATTPGDTARHTSKTQLVFNRYGDIWFLAEVWDGELSGKRYLPESHAEIEVARTHPGPAEKTALVIASHR